MDATGRDVQGAARAPSWYAVRTQPRRERVATDSLTRCCERVLCPHYRARVIVHGCPRVVARPLFPSYVFAAFEWAGMFRAVHYAHGVRGVVLFGAEPARVAPELIAGIEAHMRDGYVAFDPAPLADGQRVEVIAGPFRGVTGVFDARLSGSERVALLLDTLQFNARMMLDRAAVKPI